MSDAHGSAIIGWLGQPVLYARFARTISAEVGARFARRLTSLIGDSVAVRYFTDSSQVTSYDVMAYAAILDAVLAKRDQFALIVARPWNAPLGAKARALPGAIACLEFAPSAEEFDARLRAAAPALELQQLATYVDASAPVLVGASRAVASTWSALSDDPALPVRPGSRVPARGGAYTYVFDLDDFESGRFTATRHAHLSTRPRGTWICIARSDEQALVLARQAALVEWALPRTRSPEEFTVQFLDSPSQPPVDPQP